VKPRGYLWGHGNNVSHRVPKPLYCGKCRGIVASATDTIGKHHSFVVFFKFDGTDEHIQIIFIGFETDEFKVIFISLGREPTNIWVVRFDFDRTHIFIGGTTSPMNIRGIYSSVAWLDR
jgi:hypothetical protein